MTNLPLRVPVDCAFVIDSYQAAQRGEPIEGLDHQDLWVPILEEIRKGGPQGAEVVKVKAHTSLGDVGRGATFMLYRIYNG